MPRYYCEYCDVFLTHDALSVRRLHNSGFKHKGNVRSYYERFLTDASGSYQKALFDRMGDNEYTRRDRGASPVGDRFRRGGDAGHREMERQNRFEPYGARRGPQGARPDAITPGKGQVNEDTLQLARAHGLKLPQYGSVNMIPQQQEQRRDTHQSTGGGDISARATLHHRPPPSGARPSGAPPGLSIGRMASSTAPPPAPIGVKLEGPARAAGPSYVPPPVAPQSRGVLPSRQAPPPVPPPTTGYTNRAAPPPPVPSRPAGAPPILRAAPPPVPGKAVAPPPLPPGGSAARPPPPPVPKKETKQD